MPVEISPPAYEVIRRAYDAARRFDPEARIRLTLRGGQLETGFADSAQPEDTVVEHEGMTVFVAPEIAGVIGVSEEHQRLVLL